MKLVFKNFILVRSISLLLTLTEVESVGAVSKYGHAANLTCDLRGAKTSPDRVNFKAVSIAKSIKSFHNFEKKFYLSEWFSFR